MHSQYLTDYCVFAWFALCYTIIIRFFYFIYICLISMQRYRFRNFDKINSPEDFVEKFDEEKWLLQQKHEILKTKYKCLKQLFHVYNNSAIVHHENNIQTAKRRQCLKKNPVEKIPSACKTNISSKISDFEENFGTEITKFKYEIYKPEVYYQTKRARTIAMQTDEPEIPVAITNKGGYHALNFSEKPYREVKENQSTSKILIFKNYIQKVLGQNRETDKLPRIRNTRHISFKFSKKSLHSTHKNVGENNFSVDNNPLIVSIVEVARKTCLADKSSRKCSICGYVCYGIIEYNTHLNAAHFPERKYICYFCHESFDKASDKFMHENKHLGVKFDMTGGSSKSGTFCNKQVKRTTSQDTNWQGVDIKKIVHRDGKNEGRNTRFKDINVSMTSDLTQTTIYKTNKQSQIRKPKCPHTISSVYQADTELSDCFSSKNLSNNTNLAENFSKNVKKVSCRFCQKSFDSKCKLLYHIHLKHAEIYKSYIDASDQKDKSHGKKIERKNSNSESVCLSHLTKKSSKVSNIMNKVKNGLYNYKWEPGTRIIKI